MPKPSKPKRGPVRRRTPTPSPTRPPAAANPDAQKDLLLDGSNFPRDTFFPVDQVTGSLVDPETGEKKLLVQWQDSCEPVGNFHDSDYALQLHSAFELRQAAQRRQDLLDLAERQRLSGVATAAINAANEILRRNASLSPSPPPRLNKRSTTGQVKQEVRRIGNLAKKLERKASAEPTGPKRRRRRTARPATPGPPHSASARHPQPTV
ncbi:hypothetical protein V8E36_001100 [Tilletia maclaganii]